MKIKNTSAAPQGVHTTNGLEWLQPGQTRTLDVASEYEARVKKLPFLKVLADPLDHDADGKKGGQAQAAEAKVSEPKVFDDMTDDELRGFIADRDGKAPHPNTGREKLLAKAMGDAAD